VTVCGCIEISTLKRINSKGKSGGMDKHFRDLDIPKRTEQEEPSVPFDLEINFEYEREAQRLRLELTSGGKSLAHIGNGWISDGDGCARLAQLKILDPFLSKKKYIYGKYMKIFFRALLPRLKRDGLKAECALLFGERPAASVIVKKVEAGAVTYDLKWNAPPDSLCEIPGFSGYCESGGEIYRGSPEVLSNLPCEDGSHSASGDGAAALGALAEAAPYLFSGDDLPMLQMLGRKTGASSGIALTYGFSEQKIPADAAARPEIRQFDGPVLVSASIKPYVHADSGKYMKFINEAKRLAEYKGTKSDYLPFYAYWPTYDSMTKDRRNWYFYWRSEFFAGNVLKTDLSYIFVALYECVNICCGNAQKAFSRMVSLWRAYRGDYPVLDRYVPAWCLDFILINSLSVELESVFKGLELEGLILQPVPEIYFEESLKKGLGALPLPVLELFSTYEPRKSRFYPGHEELVSRSVRKVLSGLDALIKKVKGKTLLECFEPEPKKYVYVGYRSAICGKAASKRIELMYRPYSRSTPLKNFIGDVLRHVENLLRKQTRCAGRLRCTSLRPEVAAAIERLLRESEEGQQRASVSVDIEKALALEADSWENTKKLIEAAGGEGDEIAEITESELQSQPEIEPGREQQPEPSDIETAGIETGHCADDCGSPWEMFINSLSALELKMLRALASGAPSAELSRLAGEEYTFPEAVFEQINSRFSDIFCDVLIDLNPDPGIIEDYRGDITEILKYKA
jgi:hypothetical protein